MAVYDFAMNRQALDSNSYIGRKIKLRDLLTLFCVAEQGSMAKAAPMLSMTQPTVSQSIADLEEAVGVRLFDRSTQGVVLTNYGEILLRSGIDAFDALRQGIRGIEYLATPGVGHVYIGCGGSILHGFIPALIQRVAIQHPNIVIHVLDGNPAAGRFEKLRSRQLDLLLGAWVFAKADDDLHVETLFEESFTVVTGAQNKWAKRKRVGLEELMDEPWIFGEPSNAVQMRISEFIHSRCGRLPSSTVLTVDMNLRLVLIVTGKYLSCIPASVYKYGAAGRQIKALPVDIGVTMPIAMVKLRNRTLTPAVQLLIEQARVVAGEMGRQNTLKSDTVNTTTGDHHAKL